MKLKSMQKKQFQPSRQQGVALLEALIAVLIFSMGILAVIGLQASAVRNVTEARSRIEASTLANQQLGAMWVDRANLSSYAGSAPVAELPGGVRTITIAANQVTLTYTWTTAGRPHTYTTVTQIEGS